jgi:lysozyme family protein
MTEVEILDGVLAREGGWRPETPRPSAPPDPATNLGITLPTLRAWRNNPTLTADDLKELRPEEARQIYAQRYIADPGFTPENIPFEPLRIQLIDFGVNSGPARAIRWLQRVLRLSATGVLDQTTRSALDDWHRVDLESQQFFDTYYGLVNDALVAARSYMIDQSVDQGTMRKQDEEGVESRALSFFLAKP